jgi:hypothetical protein
MDLPSVIKWTIWDGKAPKKFPNLVEGPLEHRRNTHYLWPARVRHLRSESVCFRHIVQMGENADQRFLCFTLLRSQPAGGINV